MDKKWGFTKYFTEYVHNRSAIPFNCTYYSTDNIIKFDIEQCKLMMGDLAIHYNIAFM